MTYRDPELSHLKKEIENLEINEIFLQEENEKLRLLLKEELNKNLSPEILLSSFKNATIAEIAKCYFFKIHSYHFFLDKETFAKFFISGKTSSTDNLWNNSFLICKCCSLKERLSETTIKKIYKIPLRIFFDNFCQIVYEDWSKINIF